MTGVRCLCSPEFFETDRPSEGREGPRELQQGAILRDDVRTGFTFGGIVFEEYRGQATDGNRATVASSRPVKRVPSGRDHRHLRHLRGTGGFQRDRQYAGPAALRQAGLAKVRARYRSAYAVESAADVPSPGRAGPDES